MSIPRAVLHCKIVLQLLESWQPPGKACVYKPAAGYGPLNAGALTQQEKCCCHLCPVLVCAIHRCERLSFLPVATASLSLRTCATNHTSCPVWFREQCTLGTANATRRSQSCCADTYLYSRHSQVHCRRRTPPHPARSHLRRYPHPPSGNPWDTEGWADQANTQWLLNQTSSSLHSKQRWRVLGGRPHNQVFMSLLVRGFIQSLIQSPADTIWILLLTSVGLSFLKQ